MSGYSQPTIQEVINDDSPLPIKQIYLLNKPHAEVFRLRRELDEGVKHFYCGVCFAPVVVRGGGTGLNGQTKVSKQIAHFRHKHASPDCPYEDYLNRLPPDEVKRRLFHGLREGKKHQEDKLFVANILSSNQLVSNLLIETILKSDQSTWRKPDLSFTYKDSINIAMEFQYSTIFLTEIIGRHNFYANQNRFMLWIFDDFSEDDFQNSFFQHDIINQNKLNAFVLDELARHVTAETGTLHLTCYYRKYSVDTFTGAVDSVILTQVLTLDELKFNRNDYSVYFYDSWNDYEGALEQSEDIIAENQLKKLAKKEYRARLNRVFDQRIDFYITKVSKLRILIQSLSEQKKSTNELRNNLLNDLRKNETYLKKLNSLTENITDKSAAEVVFYVLQDSHMESLINVNLVLPKDIRPIFESTLIKFNYANENLSTYYPTIVFDDKTFIDIGNYHLPDFYHQHIVDLFARPYPGPPKALSYHNDHKLLDIDISNLKKWLASPNSTRGNNKPLILMEKEKYLSLLKQYQKEFKDILDRIQTQLKPIGETILIKLSEEVEKATSSHKLLSEQTELLQQQLNISQQEIDNAYLQIRIMGKNFESWYHKNYTTYQSTQGHFW